MNTQNPSGDMGRIRRDQANAVSIKRRFFSLPTLLSFGIAAAFIFFLTTRFDLDWNATWKNVRDMNPWLYVLALLFYYGSFGFRGVRWRLLARNAGLQAIPNARLPSAVQSSLLIVTGWFVNSITWLRLGDAYRAYAFGEESRSSFSWSLGTVLAERVIDMATVFAVLILSALLLATMTDSATSTNIVVASMIMALGLMGLMLLMKIYGRRLAQFLPNRFEEAYHRFHQGTLGSFKQLPVLFALGLGGWLMEMARLYFVVQALGLNISWPLLAIAALGHAILSAVPTPGGLGAVEPGVTGLLALSLQRHDAASIALVDRSITYVSVIMIGGLVFLIRQAIHDRSRHDHMLPTHHA